MCKPLCYRKKSPAYGNVISSQHIAITDTEPETGDENLAMPVITLPAEMQHVVDPPGGNTRDAFRPLTTSSQKGMSSGDSAGMSTWVV